MNRINITKNKQRFKNLKYLLLFIPSILISQNEMLIRQLSERMIVRENYDKNGKLINNQTFQIGNVTETEKYYEIEVDTELFDENGKSTDKYTTSYRCKPEESSTIVMVFPFYNPKKMATEINVTSKNFKELYDLNNLGDIELEMTFDSGLLNFFGSKSVIKIYDRTLEGNKTNINSKINIKAYAWGIRIKQLNYTVNEKLNGNGLLTFQKFTEEDNSYFTMTYK